MKIFIVRLAAAAALATGVLLAQAPKPPNPSAESASITVNGKTLSVKYGSPSVVGRKVFDESGPIRNDATYPIWRAGGNAATALHTDADLTIGTLSIPKGDYTLFVNLLHMDAWELVVNKQTGQSGLVYDAEKDLGRVKMTTSKPAALVEKLKYTLTNPAPGKAKLLLEWEHQGASVDITVK